MKFLILLTALAVLSACSTVIHDGDTIWWDEGGDVPVYELRALQSKRIAGKAFSSATFYLKRGCVEPTASLTFHPPVPANQQIQPPEWYDHWLGRITAHYGPELTDWYMSDWQSFRTLSGADVIAMGERQC
jgi:hypothetical protein